MTINDALQVRFLYLTQQITREEAKRQIKPYEEFFNAKSKELAKKYNQRPKLFSFSNFMR